MHDTTPEMAQKMSEMMQTKSPLERLEMGCSMYETSRQLLIRAILEHHPKISEAELRRELFLKFYGNDFDPVTREEIVTQLLRKIIKHHI